MIFLLFELVKISAYLNSFVVFVCTARELIIYDNATGYNKNGECDVEEWKDIIAVSAGLYHTVGLKTDGTVVAVGDNDYGQCNVEDWKDIVAISVSHGITVGLKSDGTVVVASKKFAGEKTAEKWKDIAAISSNASYILGLKCDGTIVTTVYVGDINDFNKLTDIRI